MSTHRKDSRKHIDRKTKIILTVLFPIIIIGWNMGFDLGVFGTVLYRNLLNSWIFTIGTLITLIYFKIRNKVTVRPITIFIISIPVVWPIIDYWDQHIDILDLHYFIVFYYITMAFCLCFTLYVFLKLIKYDLFDPLNKKNLLFIIIVVSLTTFTGFEVGLHHYLFLACGHFRISGEFIPPNCYMHPNANFDTFYRKSWTIPALKQ